MLPPRSHTNIEIVPGTLPCTSSCFGDVTSASAMSALVSDTRAIGGADVDAPSTGRPSAGPRRRRPSAARRRPSRPQRGAAPSVERLAHDQDEDAARIRMKALLTRSLDARVVVKLSYASCCSWRTTSRARLSPRMISTVTGSGPARLPPRPCWRSDARAAFGVGARGAEQRRGLHALGRRVLLVQRIAQRELNLAFGLASVSRSASSGSTSSVTTLTAIGLSFSRRARSSCRPRAPARW